ncbi:hypothetical protein [Streptomyces avidinii]|uniref:Uncharacterized protein n=1 Tax=Streptomyces avidinii TaxID=1895 RepID=A0ABS4LFQ8_STRAV|nr:hypothetical protein [Streptomyces avidinii]MBP2040876.1 hypothetical protein [Streptomyces avidinii]GGZ06228.1 hypothetical protein GCM10010343_35190 [Streptomyces avidinii]
MPSSSSLLLPDERLAAGAARLATRYAGRFAPETVLRLLARNAGRSQTAAALLARRA